MSITLSLPNGVAIVGGTHVARLTISTTIARWYRTTKKPNIIHTSDLLNGFSDMKHIFKETDPQKNTLILVGGPETLRDSERLHEYLEESGYAHFKFLEVLDTASDMDHWKANREEVVRYWLLLEKYASVPFTENAPQLSSNLALVF